jgi:hypothetical protein
MMDFDERDLFRMAEEVGFSSVGLDLEIRREPGSWFHEVELSTQHGRQSTRSHPGVDGDGVLERRRKRFERAIRPRSRPCSGSRSMRSHTRSLGSEGTVVRPAFPSLIIVPLAQVSPGKPLTRKSCPASPRASGPVEATRPTASPRWPRQRKESTSGGGAVE